MSAYICNETHIATCAAIIRALGPPNVREMATADIAEALALENMKSVAWRYSPEGNDTYAKAMAPIIGQAVEQGFTVEEWGPGEEDPLQDMLPGGQTGREYMDTCRQAQPVGYSVSEGYAYLSCLNYQSCEHPGWDESGPQEWIGTAMGGLATQIQAEFHGGREVKAVAGVPLPEGTVLCSLVHIATGAAFMKGWNIGDVQNLSIRDIADVLAGCHLGSLQADGFEMALENHVLYRRTCATAEPADVDLAEGHALMACLRDRCSSHPDWDRNPLKDWVEDALYMAMRDMQSALLEGRHVWEAPDLLDSPDTGEAPSP